MKKIKITKATNGYFLGKEFSIKKIDKENINKIFENLKRPLTLFQETEEGFKVSNGHITIYFKEII